MLSVEDDGAIRRAGMCLLKRSTRLVKRAWDGIVRRNEVRLSRDGDDGCSELALLSLKSALHEGLRRIY